MRALFLALLLTLLLSGARAQPPSPSPAPPPRSDTRPTVAAVCASARLPGTASCTRFKEGICDTALQCPGLCPKLSADGGANGGGGCGFFDEPKLTARLPSLLRAADVATRADLRDATLAAQEQVEQKLLRYVPYPDLSARLQQLEQQLQLQGAPAVAVSVEALPLGQFPGLCEARVGGEGAVITAYCMPGALIAFCPSGFAAVQVTCRYQDAFFSADPSERPLEAATLELATCEQPSAVARPEPQPMRPMLMQLLCLRVQVQYGAAVAARASGEGEAEAAAGRKVADRLREGWRERVEQAAAKAAAANAASKP